MQLKAVLTGIKYTLKQGSAEHDITAVVYDSRKVVPGALFVCIPGLKTDGHRYAQAAVEQGAVAVLAEKTLELPAAVTLLQCDDCRAALAELASNFYGAPSHSMRVVGVTGTNGKTTTTHLIMELMQAAGQKTAILGTLYGKYDDMEIGYGHTTPESMEIEAFLAQVHDRGGDSMVMEVSSHALDQKRVCKLRFASAVFTNLTQDHLDYHADMEHYAAAKAQLLAGVEPGADTFVVINRDDPWAQYFIDRCRARVLTFGMEQEADVRATDVRLSLKGTSFKVRHAGREYPVNIQLIGQFGVYNALAAIAWGLGEKLAPELIFDVLQRVTGVAGRFEQVRAGQEFSIVVDYAHTPDGLENILKTARELTAGRLITVFGCGGDRDRTKRPIMGEIAAKYSDFCIVTSDNPRTEVPEAIIDEIIPGILRVEGIRYAKIVDRRSAIYHALTMARPDDMVIIAGKGHENYQLVMGEVLDFDDRKVAFELWEGLAKNEDRS
ncbi:MAG: UDP-N-acetylmuramoyl-L-alanyl-D-glutamate--2,6-diaminopimelate ligase [Syntrophomonadaceae bacterium]|nr:UDP-N-acetylmuramoyl-L-alanyl-D-glutamate--2,6-diaminopimelate ligase [Syntrophomonadaceae bacterium]